MLRSFLLCATLLLALSSRNVSAQDSSAADPADVESVDAIIAALYDVISGPPGPRDWDRMKSLMTPSARLSPLVVDDAGTTLIMSWTPDEYVDVAGGWLETNGFFEVEVARTSERYGNLVHAFSTYESFTTLEDEAPFMRGINSIQVMRAEGRWWIHSIAWQSETPTLPIPEVYLESRAGNAPGQY